MATSGTFGSDRDTIVVLSSDVIGDCMAGPGIRYLRMAEALSPRYRTILAAPADVPRQVTTCQTVDTRSVPLSRLLKNAAAVITQGFNVHLHSLLNSGSRLIIDLYDPVAFEVMGMMGDQGTAEQRFLLSWTHRKVNLLLRSGDHFLCASGRQRYFWLGSLLALGRLNADLLVGDANAERLMTIIPFGIDDRDFPHGEKGLLRRETFGISTDDVLFYWGGGMWDWLDPFTAVKAVALTAKTHPHIKVLFLAGCHPNADIPPMNMTMRCRKLASELGLLGQQVFFLDDWLPFERRHVWLREADVGICLHPSSLETTFSFRTRLLDYLWAGLPLLVSSGDSLSGELEKAGAALTAEPGDVFGLAAAMRALADDPEGRRRMSEQSRRHSQEYRWSSFLDRLVRAVDATLARPIQRDYRRLRRQFFTLYLRDVIEECHYRGIVPTMKKKLDRLQQIARFW